MLKKFVLCGLFFGLTPIILGLCLYLANFSPFYNARFGENQTIVQTDKILGATTGGSFGDLPLTKNVIASVIRAENSTPIIIENYLRRYNSPLLPYKNKILEEADNHKVKPQLILAIAQQESNLGKKSPDSCFNAWGWAIHEKGTLCFNDWNEAIETVTSGIATGYCAKGLCEDPCEMMKKYTPSSNGSWCLAIKQFLHEMETGDF